MLKNHLMRTMLWGYMFSVPIGLFLNVRDYGGYLFYLSFVFFGIANFEAYIRGLTILNIGDGFYDNLKEHSLVRKLNFLSSIPTVLYGVYMIYLTSWSYSSAIFEPVWNRVGKEEILFFDIPLTSYRPPLNLRDFSVVILLKKSDLLIDRLRCTCGKISTVLKKGA